MSDDLRELPPDERRTSPRFALEFVVEVRPAPALGHDTDAYALRNPFRPGTIKEISTGGIYFISAMRFNVGEMVEIRLTHGERVYAFRAVARHVTQDQVSARPTFGVGAQLVRGEQTDAVLQVLIKRALSGVLGGRTR